MRKPTPSSRAMICASVVLPRPGGPWNSVWSIASPRRRALSMKTRRFARASAWPMNSSSVCGRRARSAVLGQPCGAMKGRVGHRGAWVMRNIPRTRAPMQATALRSRARACGARHAAPRTEARGGIGGTGGGKGEPGPASAPRPRPHLGRKRLKRGDRFSAGWVANSRSWPKACSGLMMNICALAGLRSAATLSTRPARRSILPSAEASHSGWPQISAPSRSASYSRERDRHLHQTRRHRRKDHHRQRADKAHRPLALFVRREPPKKKPKFASIEIAPAKVAVTVIRSVSRCRIWASSCATTPATSSGVRAFSSPRVTATPAFCGSRPVAKALGWSVSSR